MAALWRGVLSGSLSPARPAFFPESAYLQVKAIYDPQADYANRLLGGFDADLAAARALLGAEASRAPSAQRGGAFAIWPLGPARRLREPGRLL